MCGVEGGAGEGGRGEGRWLQTIWLGSGARIHEKKRQWRKVQLLHPFLSFMPSCPPPPGSKTPRLAPELEREGVDGGREGASMT